MLNRIMAGWIEDTIYEYKHDSRFGDAELISLFAAHWFNYDEKTARDAYTLWQEGKIQR